MKLRNNKNYFTIFNDTYKVIKFCHENISRDTNFFGNVKFLIFWKFAGKIGSNLED